MQLECFATNSTRLDPLICVQSSSREPNFEAGNKTYNTHTLSDHRADPLNSRTPSPELSKLGMDER